MGVRNRFAQLLVEAPSEARAVEFEEEWRSWGFVKSVAASMEEILTARRLGPETRVGVVIENRPEHVAVLVGLIASGRCVVTLSPLQPAERLAADIARSKLPVVVAAPDVLARQGLRVAIETSGVAVELSPDGTVADVGGQVRVAVTGNSGTVIEMLTSGTTGPPKRVNLREGQFDDGVGTLIKPPKSGLLRKSVTVVVAPMVHIGGFWGVMAALYAGRGVALLPRFKVESWAAAVQRHRPKAASIVPAAVQAVLEADVPLEQLASLEVVTCGTAYCPPEVAQAFFDKYGIRVLMTYGATEFAGAIAVWTKPLHERWWHAKTGSAGRATRGVELRVTGANGTPLAADEVGHLEVRSGQTPAGAGEWVRTSDLARVDEDGFLFIVGRADDAIVRGGFKVQPATVVEALERHPSVREAVVAPLSDDRLGHVPVAGVEVLSTMPRPEPAELLKLCREVLTPYEVPAHVLVLDVLPRTAAGKISRVDLLELIRNDIDALARYAP